MAGGTNQRAVANQIARSRQSRRTGNGPKAFWPSPQTGTGYQPPQPIAPPANPYSSALGRRGESNISAAMKAGAKRKGLINR